jgi:hypothetical protein
MVWHNLSIPYSPFPKPFDHSGNLSLKRFLPNRSHPLFPETLHILDTTGKNIMLGTIFGFVFIWSSRVTVANAAQTLRSLREMFLAKNAMKPQCFFSTINIREKVIESRLFVFHGKGKTQII